MTLRRYTMCHWGPQINSLILLLVEGQAGKGRGRCLVRWALNRTDQGGKTLGNTLRSRKHSRMMCLEEYSNLTWLQAGGGGGRWAVLDKNRRKWIKGGLTGTCWCQDHGRLQFREGAVNIKLTSWQASKQITEMDGLWKRNHWGTCHIKRLLSGTFLGN